MILKILFSVITIINLILIIKLHKRVKYLEIISYGDEPNATNIRQTKCDHIYKEENSDYLKTFNRPTGRYTASVPTYEIIELYAIKKTCIKCGNIEYVEKEFKK